MGCRLWGRTESDTTERLHFHFSLSCIGEGNGNPLQHTCLENPRDGGAWWAAACGVAQSRTRLEQRGSSSNSKKVKVSITQSYPTLYTPMDCCLPGFSVHGIHQVRILEWVAIPFSRGSSQLRDQTQVSCSQFAAAAAAKSLQSCLTLCDPIDGSPPGSPVPGILQGRTLEWVAISFSSA